MTMKRHHLRMFLGCLAVATVIHFAPKLGIVASTASLLVIVLMVGCCVLPILIGILRADATRSAITWATQVNQTQLQNVNQNRGATERK
jgi:hypothetical protein